MPKVNLKIASLLLDRHNPRIPQAEIRNGIAIFLVLSILRP